MVCLTFAFQKAVRKSLNRNSILVKCINVLLAIPFCRAQPTVVPSLAPATLETLVFTVAGTGYPTGYFNAADIGFKATSSDISYPSDVWGDSNGNVFIALNNLNCVRYFSTTDNILQDFAGYCSNFPTYSGDDGPATQAGFSGIGGITGDSNGNLFISDRNNNRIRLVRSVDGVVTAYAGDGNYPEDLSYYGAATSAPVYDPTGLWFGGSNLYYCSFYGVSVRFIDSSGFLNTFAGSGITGFAGDGGPATAASFSGPIRLVGDTNGLVYISDSGNNRVRVVNGNIDTAVGTGYSSFNGDGQSPLSSSLNSPAGLTLDPTSGNLFIAEAGGNRIREVDLVGLVTTYAGTGSTSSNGYDNNGDGGAATSCTFNTPNGIFADAYGKLYIADVFNNKVRVVYEVVAPTMEPTEVPTISIPPSQEPTEMPSDAPTTNVDVIDLVAGTGYVSYSSGTDFPATTAGINLPVGVWKDTLGVIYFGEYSGQCARKIDTLGYVRSFVSDCSGATSASLGDFGPATSASIGSVKTVTGDSMGNVYLADPYNYRVRMVDSVGIITSIIGDGSPVDSGLNGPATSARITSPTQVWVNSVGVVYVSALYNSAIRQITSDGILKVFAGSGSYGDYGYDGPATSASFGTIAGITGDKYGNAYLSDSGYNKVKMISSSGILSWFAGTGYTSPDPDGLAATATALYEPKGLFVDAHRNKIYIVASSSHRILKVNFNNMLTYTYAGSSSGSVGSQLENGDGGFATDATLSYPDQIYGDTNGNLYIADSFDYKIRVVTQTTAPTMQPTSIPTFSFAPTLLPTTFPSDSPTVKVYYIDTVAGGGDNGQGFEGPATAAYLSSPHAVWLNTISDDLYVAEFTGYCVRRVDSTEIIHDFAGVCGSFGVTADTGPASSALLSSVASVFGNTVGDVYLTDYTNGYVKQIDSSGIISSLAGLGYSLDYGDDGPATSAYVNKPFALWVDSMASVFFTESDDYVVRKVTTNGIINRYAGSGFYGYYGDGGPATSASFQNLYGLTGDKNNRLYISDAGAYYLRQISSDGIIESIAGTGFSDSIIDGVAATSSPFNVAGLYLDSTNHMSVCEFTYNKVRILSMATLTFYTIAGNGGYGSSYQSSGDGGAATAAQLYYPYGAFANEDSSLVYIADSNTNKVRRVALGFAPTGVPSYAPSAPPTSFYVKTVGGTGADGYTKSGRATSSQISNPTYVWASSTGNIFFSDTGNHVIRSFNESADWLTSIAGRGYAGDGSSMYATSCALNTPLGIWGDSSDQIYIVDSGNNKVRHMYWSSYYNRYSTNVYAYGLKTPIGIWGNSMGMMYVTEAETNEVKILSYSMSTTLIGTNSSGYVDNCPGTSASLSSPTGIWGSTDGMLFIADSGNGVVRQYDGSADIVSTFISSSSFASPNGVFLDQYGYMVVVDHTANSIFYLDPAQTSSMSRVAGSATQASGYLDSVTGLQALLSGPRGVFGDTSGNYYFADSSNNRVRKMLRSTFAIPTPEPTFSVAPSAAPSFSDQSNYYIQTEVGTGTAGYHGDYGLANNSWINSPTSVWCDSNGGMFVSDTLNHRVRYISVTGKMYTIAGSGTAGYSTSTYGTMAELNHPAGIYGDTAGTVYVADYKNNRIRKLTQMYTSYYYGSVSMYNVYVYADVTLPVGLWVDSQSNVYYSTPSDHTVTKIEYGTWAFSTVAGVSGISGSSGDGGPATSGLLFNPSGLHGDTIGNLFIADRYNQKIRCVSGGMLTTVAGTGVAGNSGDSGPATSAAMNNPVAVFQDSDGVLFIAERNNSNIRAARSGMMYHIAGSGVSGMGGDYSAASYAVLNHPSGLFKNTMGSIYIADKGNNRIRKLFTSPYVLPTPLPTATPAPSSAPTEYSTDYFIKTIAGNSTRDIENYIGADGYAEGSYLKRPSNIFGDTNGNIYFTEQGFHRVRRIDSYGILTTLAGTGIAGFNGLSGTSSSSSIDASSALLNSPTGIFVSSYGSVYFCDTNNNRVRYLWYGYSYTTYNYAWLLYEAATAASLPVGIWGDSVSNIYYSEAGTHSIQKIQYGYVSLYAGTGVAGFSGDGESFTNAAFNHPTGLWGNSLGDIYVIDQNNGRIRKLNYDSQIVETVAGSAGQGYVSGDGGPAASATFNVLSSISGNVYGDLYVVDRNSSEVRLIRGSDSQIELIAGNGTSGFSGDGARATAAELDYPSGVFVDSTNTIYIVDQRNNRIRKLYYSTIPTELPSSSPNVNTPLPTTFPSDAPTIKSYYISTLAGTGTQGSSGTDGPASAAQLGSPETIWQDPITEILYISEFWGYCVRSVDTSDIIHNFAGVCGQSGYSTAEVPATSAPLSNVGAVYGSSTGMVYLSDYQNAYVKVIDTSSGIMSNFAGRGMTNDAGDNGPATSAYVKYPNSLWVDTIGFVYFSEDNEYVVRRVADGYITRFAGSAAFGFFGDGGPATSAGFEAISGLTGDVNGRVYISDFSAHYIRQVDEFGFVSIAAGDGFSSNGDENVPATSTSLNAPAGLFLDSYNHLSFCEYGGNKLRMVSLATSLVRTIAGTGSQTLSTGSNGDGGAATAATMTYPLGVFGNSDSSILYVGDTGDNRVRLIQLEFAPTGTPSLAPSAPPTSFYVKSLGGTGTAGFTKSGSFSSAQINYPTYIWADTTGKIMFSDTDNHVIRSFNESSDFLTTIAGKGYAGDGSSYYATSAVINTPLGIWGNTLGNLYFCDSQNNKVRQLVWNSYYSKYNFNTIISGLKTPIGLWGDTVGQLYVTEAETNEVKVVTAYYTTYTLIGTNSTGYVDNVAASAASLSSPTGIWGNTNGMLFIADSGNGVVRQYSASTGIVSTLVSSSLFSTPHGVFFDQYDYLVVVDHTANSIFYLDPAQTSSMSRIGGSSSQASGFVDNVLGTLALMNGPTGVFGDTSGNYYFTDSTNNRVRKLFRSSNPIPTPSPTFSAAPTASPTYSDEAPYYISTAVGTGDAGFHGDYAQASSSWIHSPTSVWCDTNGGMFISDTLNHRIRYVSSSGTMYTVAGSGVAGYSTSTYGTQAQLNHPAGIFGDSTGNVYVADYKNNRIRKLYVQYATYYYGSISQYYVSVYANVTLPYGLWMDTQLNAYYTEPSSHTVKKVDHSTKSVSIVAGVSGISGSSGDGGPATSGLFYHPAGIFGNSAGVLYIADQYNHRIRCVSGGMVTAVAGNGVAGNSGDSGPATSAALNNPIGVFQDSDGELFIVDRNNSNIRATRSGTIYHIAGSGVSGMDGDYSLAAYATLSNPTAVFKNTVGTIYIADKGNNRIRKLFTSSYVLPTPLPTTTPGPTASPSEFPTGYFIETIAGNSTADIGRYIGAGVSALGSYLKRPSNIYGDTNGNIYFTEQGFHRIRRIDTSGILTTIGGNGTAGYNGDDSYYTSYVGTDATTGMFNSPSGIFVSTNGYVYVCDTKNGRIRYLSYGYTYITYSYMWRVYEQVSGASTPVGIWGDTLNNVYYSEAGAHVIKKLVYGSVSLYAGSGVAGFSGDGGSLTAAQFNHPTGLWGNSLGDLYVIDQNNGRIRKLSYDAGSIETVTGSVGQGYVSGDGGPAASATFNLMVSLSGNAYGDLYVVDRNSSEVRLIRGSDSQIELIAGNGTSGFRGDGGRATSAMLHSPSGVFVDSTNTIYIVDQGNYRIRQLYYSTIPTYLPTLHPSLAPTAEPPTSQPTRSPTNDPTSQPSDQPTYQPSGMPTGQPTIQPSGLPTEQPSSQPTSVPSSQPTIQPSEQPSRQPSSRPTSRPSIRSTSQPTCQPSGRPTMQPSEQPTGNPSGQPSVQPSSLPSGQPSAQPSVMPSGQPTKQPTSQPSRQPTTRPTFKSTSQPTSQPSQQPTDRPSGQPTSQPSVQPISRPSSQPSGQPSGLPSSQPSIQPSGQPTSVPSGQPSRQPTCQPSGKPTSRPTFKSTSQPTCQPSGRPTMQPSAQPTGNPSGQPSVQPSGLPSGQPSAQPSVMPSGQPTKQPTSQPSRQPTTRPTFKSTSQPTSQPSQQPTDRPSGQPTSQPSVQPISRPSSQPSGQPSGLPSSQPSIQPSGQPTSVPSAQPSRQPTCQPSGKPTSRPTFKSTSQPTCQPSSRPTMQPSAQPTGQPTSQPSVQPTRNPTRQPTGQPTSRPTIKSTGQPTSQPSAQPSRRPSGQPSSQPSGQPSTQPTGQPSTQPTAQPTSRPTCRSTARPTSQPSAQPSGQPSAQPSGRPSGQPTGQPTAQPVGRPTSHPTAQPSAQPSGQPSSQPSGKPTTHPLSRPTSQPTAQPTGQPSMQPVSRPSAQPTGQPTRRPTSQPTGQPSGQPSRLPTGQPTSKPSSSKPTPVPTRSPTYQTATTVTIYFAIDILTPVSTLDDKGKSAIASTAATVLSLSSSAVEFLTYAVTGSSRRLTEHLLSTFTLNCNLKATMSLSQFSQFNNNATALLSFLSSQLKSSVSSGVFTSTLQSTSSSLGSNSTLTASASSVTSTSSSVILPPTFRPTVVPTIAPSFSISSLWTNQVQVSLAAASVLSSSRVIYQRNYYELDVAGYSPYKVYGSCTSWASLLSNDLVQNSYLYSPFSIKMSVTQALTSSATSFNTTSIVCSSPSAILNALYGTQNVANLTVGITTVCDGHSWVVKLCSGKPSVCVDCADPCDANAHCSANNQIVVPYSIAPCVTQACGSTTTAGSSIRILTVNYASLSVAPDIKGLMLSSTKSSITVTATLAAEGSVYCGAFPINTAVGSNLQTLIALQNFNAPTTNNGTTIVVTGLTPITRYAVYCYSVSSVGAVLSLSKTISSGNATTTACCKTLSVTLSSTSVVENQAVSNLVYVRLSSKPSTALQLALTTPSGVTLFTPSTFSVGGLYDSSAQVIDGVVRLRASLTSSVIFGKYKIQVALVGAASEYEVEFSNNAITGLNYTMLSVYSSVTPPSAPVLLSAIFSNDGTSLYLKFDSATNRGGMSTSFVCSSLFRFACASTSTCIWTDASSVTAVIAGSSQCVIPTNNVTFSSTAAVKAQCPLAPCNAIATWNNSVTAGVIVQSPTTAIYPTIVVSAPSTVGSCDNITIDISGSSGSGGRSFTSASISVAGVAGSSADSIQAYLASKSISTSLKVSIPGRLINKGFVYSFTISLCNFMGPCSVAYKQILVLNSIVPVISLPGAPLRTITRNSQLSISSLASVAYCDGLQTDLGLLYNWTVFNQGVELLAVKSVSKDSSKLLLDPYSLSTFNTYTVQLTVTQTSNAVTSVVAVNVYVASGSVFAVISGGSVRSVRLNETAIIDGSSSYDEDVNTATGSAAGLIFTWECVQLAPVYNETCINSLVNVPNTVPDFYTVLPQISASVDAVCQITLTVTDASGLRSSEATVTISLLLTSSPLVAVNSGLANGIMNQPDVLRLTARVVLPPNAPGNASWSVDDDSYELSQIALSPLAVSILPSSLNPVATMYLVIKSNALAAGTSLTFSMTCLTATTSTVTSVLVTVNSPPSPGIFTMSPTVGTELVDPFTFSAALWHDDQLPVTYQFGYLSSVGVLTVLKPNNEFTSVSSILPAGLPSSGFMVTCVAAIYDALDANNTATNEVRVDRITGRNAAQTSAYVDTSFTRSSASTNGILQSTAIASYLLNLVNCTTSVDCASLNRQECSQTAHTCGSCISADYFGISGDSNEPCVSLTANTTVTTGSSCTQDSDCNGFDVCTNHKCITPLKECAGNCSNHGVCSFVNSNTGEPLNEPCYVGAVNCTTQCVCESGYTSSTTCSVSDADMVYKQTARDLVVNNVALLIAREDPDKQTISGWMSIAAQASQQPDELTATSVNAMFNITKSILTAATAQQFTYEMSTTLLSVIDTTSLALQPKGRRRLNEVNDVIVNNATGGNFSSSIGNTIEVLQQFGSMMTQNMVPGEAAVNAVYSQFRLNSQVVSPYVSATSLITESNSSSTATVSLPQSTLESMNGQLANAVSVPLENNNQTGANIALTTLTVRSELYGSSSAFQSNPTTLMLSSLPCSSSQCYADFTMQLTSNTPDESSVESVNTTCTKGKVESIYHSCSNGYVLNITCNGTVSGTTQSQCPIDAYLATCNSLSDSSISDVGCQLTSYTNTSVVCSCPLVLSVGVTDDVDIDTSTAATGYSVSYVAMLKVTTKTFVNTWRSAAKLNAGTLKRSWKVIVTIGVFAGMAGFFLFFAYRLDLRTKQGHLSESIILDLTLWRSLNHTIQRYIARSRRKESQVAPSMTAVVAASKLKHKHKYKYKKETKTVHAPPEVALVEESLPAIMHSSSLWTRINTEIKTHHRWLSVVYFYTENFPRALRVLALVSSIISMLFFQSITYNLSNPDDGSCTPLEGRAACTTPKSPYSTGVDKCVWTDTGGDSGECSFNEPANNVKTILFVAIFSAVLSTPIAVMTHWLIKHKLAAPDYNPLEEESKKLEKSLMVKPGSGRSERRVDKGGSKNAVLNEVQQLSQEIKTYRTALHDADDIKEFDDLWGLDADGNFKAGQQNSICSKKEPNVLVAVIGDVSNVHRIEKEESQIMEELSVNKKDEIGKRLLFLLQCDLLPGLQGKVMEAKYQRNHAKAKKSVKMWEKQFWFGFIVLLHVGMLFYILLFAISQTKYRQDAWFNSFIMWLFLEIFLNSTASVIITHVLIPSVAMKDVSTVKSKLIETVRQYQHDLNTTAGIGNKNNNVTDFDHEETGVAPFNAANYLYVSTRLAKKYPDLKEAHIISKFSTPWPKQSYLREFDAFKGYDKGTAALTNALTVVMVVLLTNILNIPPSFQDLLIDLLSTITTGYVILGHLELWKVVPILAFLPAFILCIVIHFVFQSQASANRIKQARLHNKQLSRVSSHSVSHQSSNIGSDGEFHSVADHVSGSFSRSHSHAHSLASSFHNSNVDEQSISFPFGRSSKNQGVDVETPVNDDAFDQQFGEVVVPEEEKSGVEERKVLNVPIDDPRALEAPTETEYLDDNNNNNTAANVRQVSFEDEADVLDVFSRHDSPVEFINAEPAMNEQAPVELDGDAEEIALTSANPSLLNAAVVPVVKVESTKHGHAQEHSDRQLTELQEKFHDSHLMDATENIYSNQSLAESAKQHEKESAVIDLKSEGMVDTDSNELDHLVAGGGTPTVIAPNTAASATAEEDDADFMSPLEEEAESEELLRNTDNVVHTSRVPDKEDETVAPVKETIVESVSPKAASASVANSNASSKWVAQDEDKLPTKRLTPPPPVSLMGGGVDISGLQLSDFPKEDEDELQAHQHVEQLIQQGVTPTSTSTSATTPLSSQMLKTALFNRNHNIYAAPKSSFLMEQIQKYEDSLWGQEEDGEDDMDLNYWNTESSKKPEDRFGGVGKKNCKVKETS